jgi:hypothetical protein
MAENMFAHYLSSFANYSLKASLIGILLYFTAEVRNYMLHSPSLSSLLPARVHSGK